MANAAELGLAELHLPPPLNEWAGALPAIPLGLAIAHCVRETRAGRRARLFVFVLAASVASTFASPMAGGHEDVVRRFAVATCLATAGFAWKPRIPARLAALAGGTFGVYLVHPFVFLVLRRLPGLPDLPPLVFVSLVWGLAYLGVVTLGRLPLDWSELRWLAALRGVEPEPRGMSRREAG